MTDNKEQIVSLPHLSEFPVSARVLITIIIVSLSAGMAGAAGQILIHDIIPTFFSEGTGDDYVENSKADNMSHHSSDRRDLFAGEQIEHPQPEVDFLESEQFIWALKWTHIHLFGIGFIFIIMGCITLLLHLKDSLKIWLIILPFVGIFIDISALWLKTFISPHFFWLHLPGGNLFVLIFFYVSMKSIQEMWFKPQL